MPTSFAVTWDYRCPFARNVHEHLVIALEAGGPWDVQFVAFSLDQPHVEEGQPAVFDQPDRYPGLLANEVGIVVRDRMPERFLATHRALFDARHRDGADLRRREVIAPVLESAGVAAADVFAEVDAGWPLEAFRKEHMGAVDGHEVFGVPTFVLGNTATFVRLMDRPDGDATKAVSTIARIVELLTGWPELNELKQTRIPN